MLLSDWGDFNSGVTIEAVDVPGTKAYDYFHRSHVGRVYDPIENRKEHSYHPYLGLTEQQYRAAVEEIGKLTDDIKRLNEKIDDIKTCSHMYRRPFQELEVAQAELGELTKKFLRVPRPLLEKVMRVRAREMRAGARVYLQKLRRDQVAASRMREQARDALPPSSDWSLRPDVRRGVLSLVDFDAMVIKGQLSSPYPKWVICLASYTPTHSSL